MATKTSTKARPKVKAKPKTAARRKPGPKGKHYTDRDKAAALAFCDYLGGKGHLGRASKALKVSRSTLTDWYNERGINADVQVARTDQRDRIANILQDAVLQSIPILPSLVPKANYDKACLGTAILLSKIKELLDNAPSSADAVPATVLPATMTDDDAKAEAEALVERIMKQAEEQGEATTRDVVVAGIVARKPELAPFLGVVSDRPQ